MIISILEPIKESKPVLENEQKKLEKEVEMIKKISKAKTAENEELCKQIGTEEFS